MPIPQFHRTPKTRRRRTHRGATTEPRAVAQDPEADITPAPRPAADAMSNPDNAAIPKPADDEDVATDHDEVPALLSCWPPERRKSSS